MHLSIFYSSSAVVEERERAKKIIVCGERVLQHFIDTPHSIAYRVAHIRYVISSQKKKLSWWSAVCFCVQIKKTSKKKTFSALVDFIVVFGRHSSKEKKSTRRNVES